MPLHHGSLWSPVQALHTAALPAWPEPMTALQLLQEDTSPDPARRCSTTSLHAEILCPGRRSPGPIAVSFLSIRQLTLLLEPQVRQQ